MAKTEKNREDLSYMGIDYQIQLLKCLVEDKEYAKNILPILDQNAFDEELRRIANELKNRYVNQGIIPTYRDLENIFRSTLSNGIILDKCLAYLGKIKEIDCGDIQMIEKISSDFFKQQNLKKAIIKAGDIIKKGDSDRYEEIESIFKKALEENGRDTFGFYHVFDDFDEALSESYRCAIPTGAAMLDKALNGGLGKRELGIIIAPSGIGKALSIYEKVLTPKGYVQMKDVHVGDNVVGRDGKPTKVVAVYPKGKRKIYKVTFNDGSIVRCDKEHLWAVNTKKQRDNGDFSYIPYTLKQIIEEGVYAEEFEPNFQIPMSEPIQFEKKDVEISPYIVGCMLGSHEFDEKQCFFVQKNRLSNFSKMTDFEKEIVFFDDFVTVKVGLDFSKKINGKSNYEIQAEDFLKNYIQNDIETRMAVFDGFMDMYNFSSRLQHFVCNEIVAKTIKEISFSLGIYCSVDVLGEDFCRVKIDKKRKYREIVNIEYDKMEEAQCITVDAEDELYITRDYVVTHNTSATTGFAAYAAMYRCEENNYNGFKVFHIHFEDEDNNIKRKYYAYLTGVEACYLSMPENRGRIKEFINTRMVDEKQMLSENIVLKHPMTSSMSASDIKHEINHLIATGFKPDLVIIDYFECLKLEKPETNNDTDWSREALTMRKLESIAHECNVAIWCPVQGNRESINKEFVGMEQGGGSITKVQIGHVVISFARTNEMKPQNLINIFIHKFRAGAINEVEFRNVGFNNGTCRFSGV